MGTCRPPAPSTSKISQSFDSSWYFSMILFISIICSVSAQNGAAGRGNVYAVMSAVEKFVKFSLTFWKASSSIVVMWGRKISIFIYKYQKTLL